jgi:hypothetical protein
LTVFLHIILLVIQAPADSQPPFQASIPRGHNAAPRVLFP